MATVTVRDLARSTAAVIDSVSSSGRPALVTRNGRPVAALVPIDEVALEDWLLSHAAEFTATVADSDGDLAVGRTEGRAWRRARQSAGNGDGAGAAAAPRPRHLRGSHRGA